MKILIDTKKSTLDEEIWKSRGKAIAFTVAPFGIPLILSLVPDSLINSLGKMVIVILLFVIDIYWVMKITVRDSKELYRAREKADTNKKYYISRKVLNRLSNCERVKGGFIQDETYKKHYDYIENVLLYNPHRYLERVCDEIKTLISDITHIDLEYVSVSFIYKYPNDKTTKDHELNKWQGWKWITGKDSTTSLGLNEMINRNDSYYHYLIANDMVTSFENDKSRLIERQKYYVGEKDNRHNTYGSISAHKMSFRNNNYTFCTSYLIISTYGKKFYTPYDENEFCSEEEFQEVLFEQIIPHFRKVIETELGLMYMRHKERNSKHKNKKEPTNGTPSAMRLASNIAQP